MVNLLKLDELKKGSAIKLNNYTASVWNCQHLFVSYVELIIISIPQVFRIFFYNHTAIFRQSIFIGQTYLQTIKYIRLLYFPQAWIL